MLVRQKWNFCVLLSERRNQNELQSLGTKHRCSKDLKVDMEKPVKHSS